MNSVQMFTGDALVFVDRLDWNLVIMNSTVPQIDYIKHMGLESFKKYE